MRDSVMCDVPERRGDCILRPECVAVCDCAGGPLSVGGLCAPERGGYNTWVACLAGLARVRGACAGIMCEYVKEG